MDATRIAQHVGAIDVCFDPNNPRILFAALWQARRTPWSLTSGGPGSGLYRSDDGGDTWKQLGPKKFVPLGAAKERRPRRTRTSPGPFPVEGKDKKKDKEKKEIDERRQRSAAGHLGPRRHRGRAERLPAASTPSSRRRRAACIAPTTAARLGAHQRRSATCSNGPGISPSSTSIPRTPTSSSAAACACSRAPTAARPSRTSRGRTTSITMTCGSTRTIPSA